MDRKRAELIATIQKAMALARETGSDMTGYLLETALEEELSREREEIAAAKREGAAGRLDGALNAKPSPAAERIDSTSILERRMVLP